MKLSIKELQVGQKLKTVSKYANNTTDRNNEISVYSSLLHSYEELTNGDYVSVFFKEDVLLEVTKIDLKSKSVRLKLLEDTQTYTENLNPLVIMNKGFELSIFLTNLRQFTVEYGEILPHPDILQYRIFKGDKPIKPKYFSDLGKVKSALLFMFDYFSDEYEMIEKYAKLNPELEYSTIPEFGYTDIKIDDSNIDEISVVEYTNKKNPKKLDFDVKDYFLKSKLLKNITYKFGEAARGLFKDYLYDKKFEYIFVYIPDEYRTLSTNRYFDYSQLKESPKIKEILKLVKEYKKTTKCGKTAIAVNTDDLNILLSNFKTSEYKVLNCDGDNLVLKNNRLVKLDLLEVL
jgi:hypothetical protein